MKRLLSFLIIALLATSLGACTAGGLYEPYNPPTNTYTVGGTLTGLSGTIILQNNAMNDLSITGDGAFTFTTAIADGAAYAVTVMTQPTGQTCEVTDGTGIVSGANVTNVTVTCADTPTSTSITPADESIVLRTMTQYRLWDADGVERTEEAVWSSADESIFTVSDTAGTKGLVTAVSIGDARVRAAYGGETASTLVTVTGGLNVVSGIAVSDLTTASIGNSNTSRNITVDRDLRIHTVWVRSGTPEIRYSRSLDLGDTFTASVQDDNGGATLSATVEPVIASSGKDTVYISYLDTAGSIYLIRSIDGGDTWSAPAKVADSLGAGITKLSISTYNEYLYILPNTNPLQLVVSSDYGVSSSITTTVLAVRVFEDVLADPSNGDIYILQDDPTLYWAISTDNGATFSAQVHITDVSVYYSDYTISQLGSIFIAGSAIVDNDAAVFDLASEIFTQANYAPTALAQQASVAIDGLNMVHIVGNVDGDVYLYDSDDSGASYTNQLIVSGATKPDIAPTTFVDGAPMVYLKDNSIFYTYVRDE